MNKTSDEMILRMEGIVKSYGSLLANDHVDLALGKGEILAVIGENGAGKTTLMKVLYGLEHPDSGRILIRGKEKRIRNPAQAIAAGVGMVQQHFMLFDPFTVAENVVYGREPKKKLFFDARGAEKLVAGLSKSYELPLDPGARVQGMPVGLRQRVEIIKVLYQNTDIIIFDEPTAVLTPQEARELLRAMKNLAAKGKSIILITHKLNEVMEVADRALVMRQGRLVGEAAIGDATIEELSYMMVGRHLAERDVPAATPGSDVLSVRGLRLSRKQGADVLRGLSLHVGAGEIVGVAGVSGNGQSELVECLFGLRKCDGGSIKVGGREISACDVREVRRSGVALIPEDRFLWGSAREAAIAETALMAHYAKPAYSRAGLLRTRRVRGFARGLVKEFGVKADDVSAKTGSLSGGNAQKLIAAREIAQGTPLLIACEPTRGVDVGAMEFIHEKLIEKRAQGGAVLLVSSELSEIIKLSDRIYVIYEGQIRGEFARGHVDEEELGLLMVGGKSHGQT